MPIGRPWRLAPGGLMLAVRATPKGGRDAVDGVTELADGTAVLKVRVRAAAADGEANAAVLRVVAGVLRLPAGAVRLASGAKGRVKQLEISGEGAALAAALERLCAG
jgi:uncharacterized protein YggU (UPF0235/DUF167 family)